MDINRLFTFVKSLPTWARIVAILASAVAAIAFTSCSRSSIAFKGEGQVEFVYKGTNGPNFSNDGN